MSLSALWLGEIEQVPSVLDHRERLILRLNGIPLHKASERFTPPWWSALDVLHQETLLTLLQQMERIEQDRLLRVMYQLDDIFTVYGSGALAFIPVVYHTKHRLLDLLTRLQSVHRSNLLMLLDLMGPEEQERLITTLGCLEHLEQMTLLGTLSKLDKLDRARLLEIPRALRIVMSSASKRVLGLAPKPSLEMMLDGLEPHEQRTLLRLLDGLDHANQVTLLTTLKHISQPHKVLEMMITLKKHELLRLLDSPEDISAQIDGFLHFAELEPQQQRQLERVTAGLGDLQKYMMSPALDGLEPHEQRVLVRVLGGLGCNEQKKVLKVILGFHKMGYLSSNGARSPLRAPVLMYLLGCEQHQPLDRSALQHCLDNLDPLECKELLKALDRLNPKERSELKIFREMLALREYMRLLQHLLLLMCLLGIFVAETDPQGGFRNLLLDGWWLEFWEIILLAAGDVERNPGPRRMTDEELCKIDDRVLEKDAFFDVYDAVYECRAKWRNLCLALRISHSDLSAIEEKRRGDTDSCLQDGLSLWLKGNRTTGAQGRRPTWRTLVDAVANSAGGDDHTLALEIAKKHQIELVATGAQAEAVLEPAWDDHDREREETRWGHQHSAAFSRMYGAITRSMGRSLGVDDLRQFLRFFSHPHSPSQRYIEPSVYMRAESTRDIMEQLYPVYVNPGNIYLLEEIVEQSTSRQCKRLLREYMNKYH